MGGIAPIPGRSGRVARLARILLGHTPSDDARRIFEADVAGATWSTLGSAVAALEELSLEELAHVNIDAMIANTRSVEWVQQWLQLILLLVVKHDCLPPLPQPTDPDGLRSTASKAGGVWYVVGASYVPEVGGEESPHLPMDKLGAM